MASLRSGLTGTQLVQLALNESVAYGCSHALSGKREERKKRQGAGGGEPQGELGQEEKEDAMMPVLPAVFQFSGPALQGLRGEAPTLGSSRGTITWQVYIFILLMQF